MVNTILTTAIGALMFFSPQTELGFSENISLRETDLQSIASQAQTNSTHLSYRKPIEPVNPADIQKKTVEPAVTPVQVQTASISVPKRVPLPDPVELESMVERYAAQYGARKDVMMIIMKCESGLNPNAASGPFAGLFQFMASTWSSNRKAMGLDPNPSLRFNAEEAIKTAAFKMGRDGYSAWPACSAKAFRQIEV